MKALYKCKDMMGNICMVVAKTEDIIETIKEKGKEQFGVSIVEVIEEKKLEANYKCGGNCNSRKKVGFIKGKRILCA